jgi:predicted N-acetyltransferase YhbS
VLAAEVLDSNPARTFYERVRYSPISHSARIDATAGPSLAERFGRGWVARVAQPQDAPAIASLDAILAASRRAAGDIRFDPPMPVDATKTKAMAAHFGSNTSPSGTPLNPVTLVSVDCDGVVGGAAFFALPVLAPPFLPKRLALLGPVAVDPACPTQPVFSSLLALACRRAVAEGVPYVEVTDLPRPGAKLHSAALAAGAVPWSRVLGRLEP